MLAPIPEILEELRNGRMVVVVDDADRENEGDLVVAARFATPDAINFMLREARGYLFLSLTSADCDRLDLHPQTPVNTSVRGTPLTVSIDGHPKHGFTTGVSAHERARTIALAIDPGSGPDDFVRPGHVNPLRARDGGVLVRTGHTEALVDLCRLAGLTPAAVGIEIMREDGHMARAEDLERICAAHNLKMCSIQQIIEHRLAGESLVRRLEPRAGAPIRTAMGDFTLIAYQSTVDPLPHLALVAGGVGSLDPAGHVAERPEPTLVRMHRRDLLGDIFHEIRDGAPPTARVLHASMRAILDAGAGALVYLRTMGTGVDFAQRLIEFRGAYDPRAEDAPDLASTHGVGASAVPMHTREFGVGGQILRDLGLSRLRLLTNQKKQLPGLEAFGLEIVEHVALP